MSKRLNMTLDGEVRIVLNIYLEGDWTNNDNQGPCTNDCEELNVTLLKGNVEVAREQFNGIDGGDADTRTWQIPVDSNTTRWNKSVDEPAINFRWVGYAEPTTLYFSICAWN